jgi:hypothetical protein
MNNPELTLGVSFLSKQCCCLPGILFTLVSYVLLDDLFADAGSGYKVSFRPNTVCAPIYPFEIVELLFEGSGGVGLD